MKRRGYLIALLSILLLTLVSCSSNSNSDVTLPTSSGSKENAFTEKSNQETTEKNTVKVPEKKESATTYVPPVEKEMPTQEETEPPAPLTTVQVEVEPKESAVPAEQPVTGREDFVKEARFVTTENYHGSTHLVDVMNYGYTEVSEAQRQNYNINSMVIDEGGETLLFIPHEYGGNFKVQRIEYDPEAKGFYLRDILFTMELIQDDAISLKMYIPETAPSVLITYEKEGEFIAQTIPTYDGQNGGIHLDKGFSVKTTE